MSSVLVTGTSRGIGRAIALGLAEHGWTVYAGVRREEDGARLKAEASGRELNPVIVDVTDADSLAGLAERLGGRLDALVNNAGIVVPGPIEGLAIEELRRQFDVNLVGQVASTQAVLPLLRHSRGRIVFIGSISGRVSSPLMGAYAASKFALEGLVDALRVELRPWKIRVSLVEPGSIDTDLWRKAPETTAEVASSLAPEHRELYRDHLEGIQKLIPRIQKQTSSPAKVAATVETALTAARPKARYLVGNDARAQATMRALVPTPLLDTILARVSGIR